MLKGQLDIDIEFMGGTIVFVILGSLLYLMILAPILAVQHASSEANKDVVGMEFANIAKYRLIHEAGDGLSMVEHAGLSAAVAAQTSGTTGGYFTVTELITEKVWEFDGDRNKDVSHDTFAAMKADFLPVFEGSEIVMESGRDYVVHAYTVQGTLMFDIHDEIICGDGATEEPSLIAPSCDEVKALVPATLDADGVSGSCIVPVKNGTPGVCADSSS